MNTSLNKLSLETIATLAERDSGAYGMIDIGLRQRVASMIDWINGLGDYTPEQILPMQRQLQQLLANRLRIAADRKHYSAIAKEEITQPIFVVGFGRSGTTLLQTLLAEDPDVLAPRSWHTHTPSPPPGAGPVCTGRIAFADRAVQEWIDFAPSVLQMHPYSDAGAHQLIEDEEIFGLDFRNAYPGLMYKVPRLDVNVILGADAVGAFRFHREMLQHLQWNTGKNRWICKCVSAQHLMGALLEAYPDALCVWTHRPLVDIYASNVAIRAAIYDSITGRANDWSSQAKTHALGMKAAVDRLMKNSMINDPRIMHIPFKELTSDPIDTIRRIYEKRGITMSPAHEDRVRTWLASPENRVDRYGRYPYSYEAFGLDRKWIEELFADYNTYFGLSD